MSSRRRTVNPFRARRRKNHQTQLPPDSAEALRFLLHQMQSDPVQRRIIEQSGRPLSEHVNEYRACLEAKGDTARHVRELVRRIRLMLRLCKAAQFAQLSTSAIQIAIGKLRATRPRRRSHGPATANHYLSALKSFCWWMVIDARAGRSPCQGLRRLNPRIDVRKKRRAFSEEELRRLIAAANAGPAIGEVSGAERALMYELAASTGLRSSEIQTLNRSSFVDLDGPAPHVVVEAAYSKHRRRDVVPLRADLSARLRRYLDGLDRDDRVFRRPSCNNGMRSFRDDLAAAGIPYRLNGQDADFHSLRHTFITRVLRSGVSPKEVQELARHQDPQLTLALYAHADDAAKRAAVEKLGSLATKGDMRAALDEARYRKRRRTFTEDKITWLSAMPLRRELDIGPEAADLLCDFDRTIPTPRVEKYRDGSRERFWPREPLARWIESLRSDASRRRAARPIRQQIEQLPPETRVGIEAAEALGFSVTYMRFHSRIEPPEPRVNPTPDPALGRLFDVAYRPRLWRRRHVILEKTWLVGELLESSVKRGTSPDLPAGCVLVRDAAKKFRLSHAGMLRRVASLGLPQRMCTRIKRTGAAQPTSYLTPEDQIAIDPQVNEDPRFVTVREAARLAGTTTGRISWAASAGKLTTNGKRFWQKRIDRACLEVWIEWRRQKLERRERREAQRRRP